MRIVAMEIESLTTYSLPAILLDANSRRALLDALRNETQATLPLHNHIADIAPNLHIDPEQLDRLVTILLKEEKDRGILCELLFHPNMPESALFRILDARRCINNLGHRRGPESLLLRLATEHRFEEAILTLALVHYAPDVVSEEKFLAFVQQYIAMKWLRDSIRLSDLADTLSGNKRESALALISAYEAAHGPDADWAPMD